MLVEVMEWLLVIWQMMWIFLSHAGYFGLFIILYPVLKKIVALMRQFIN